MNAKPGLAAELLSEFLGTFVLILFGTGVVAMVVLFPSSAGEECHGWLHQHHAGWGFGNHRASMLPANFRGALEPGPST